MRNYFGETSPLDVLGPIVDRGEIQPALTDLIPVVPLGEDEPNPPMFLDLIDELDADWLFVEAAA
jgi:hypothetical protein